VKTTEQITRFHISIAFYGEYKPLHLPSSDIETLKRYANAKVMNGAILESVMGLIKDFTRQRNAGISLVSASSEGHGLAISIREGQRDNWLDEITDKLPEHPQINYTP
jgi:hypothetical protein